MGVTAAAGPRAPKRCSALSSGLLCVRHVPALGAFWL